MEITFHYKDELDKKSILYYVNNQGWIDDIEVMPGLKKIVVAVSDGGDDEAEAFAIAQRYRGRKVVINA